MYIYKCVFKRLSFLSRDLYCIYIFSLHSKNKTIITNKTNKPGITKKPNKTDILDITNKPGKPDIPNITNKPNKPDKPGIPVLPGAVSVDR